MSEQFVKLENGTNISIESFPDDDEVTVNAAGQPITICKYFGPLSMPNVRVQLDRAKEQWVIEIQVECDEPHDVGECEICAGDVWTEVYRGCGENNGHSLQ